MTKIKTLFMVAVMAALVVVSCNNDTGTEPEKNPNDPALAVEKTTLDLTGNTRWDHFDVSNSGGGQLVWSIAEYPEWVDLNDSLLVDLGKNEMFTLFITILFDQLDYGTHSGQIKIESNAGAAVVDISFEYNAPVLKVDKETINLDRHYRYSEIILENAGGAILQWKIAQAPEWLRFEQVEGNVYYQPETVPFSAVLSSLEYGDYEDQIIIESNGGTFKVNVFLTYEREVEVFAGIGAANIELGDTYLMVEKLYGKPNSSGYVRPEKTVFIHNILYTDIGLDLRIKNNSPVLFGNGPVGFIRMVPPYDGMTPRMIGLGSSSSDLIAAIGEPQQKDGDEWIYEGIIYVIKSNKVAEMIIKEPDF